MALLWIDGFDNLGTLAVALVKYDPSTSTQTVGGPSTAQARTGAYSYRISTEDVFSMTTIGATTSTCIFGFALYVPSGSYTASAAPTIFMIREGTTCHFALGLDTTFHLTAYRGNGTSLLGTAAAALSPNTWYYIEGKVVINDTTGSYDIHVDGTSALSASSQDTRNGATGVWNNFGLGGPYTGASSFLHFDDLYVADTAATNPLGITDPIVDIIGTSGHLPQVTSQLPKTDAAGAGTNANFTPSTGTDHGALVDEQTPNSDTDYNAGTTVGHKDTYQMTAMTLGGAIYGRQANVFIKKTDAGSKSVQIVTRSGGADTNGASQNPLTTYAMFSEVRSVDTATSIAWTNSGINNEEVGLRISA